MKFITRHLRIFNRVNCKQMLTSEMMKQRTVLRTKYVIYIPAAGVSISQLNRSSDQCLFDSSPRCLRL